MCGSPLFGGSRERREVGMGCVSDGRGERHERIRVTAGPDVLCITSPFLSLVSKMQKEIEWDILHNKVCTIMIDYLITHLIILLNFS